MGCLLLVHSRALVDAGFVPNDMQWSNWQICATSIHLLVVIIGAFSITGMKDSK